MFKIVLCPPKLNVWDNIVLGVSICTLTVPVTFHVYILQGTVFVFDILGSSNFR